MYGSGWEWKVGANVCFSGALAGFGLGPWAGPALLAEEGGDREEDTPTEVGGGLETEVRLEERDREAFRISFADNDAVLASGEVGGDLGEVGPTLELESDVVSLTLEPDTDEVGLESEPENGLTLELDRGDLGLDAGFGDVGVSLVLEEVERTASLTELTT